MNTSTPDRETPQTVFDALLDRLTGAAVYNPDDEVAPAAILWPDQQEQWLPLAPRLRQELPHFLTLGEYDPAAKTGPAIWLKCLVDRTLPEADWTEDVAPLIYLPGLSRQDLQPAHCPRPAKPLVELQYRGAVWAWRDDRDWTVHAFLTSQEGGLGLDVAADTTTRQAAQRALLALANTPLAELQGRRLQAADFDALLHPDEARDLLLWLNDQAGTRATWDDSVWEAFRDRCRQRYDFDPETDGALIAAEKLGQRDGHWHSVWQRFAEAPHLYRDLPGLLRQARPATADGLFFNASSWPQENEQAEEELRAALMELKDRPPAEARQLLRRLDNVHGDRRRWVWAKLGQARLAQASEHLVRLAEHTAQPVGGATPNEIAEAYVRDAWQADAAALDALALVETPEDQAALQSVLGAVYRPWLEDSALHFQQAIQRSGLPFTASVEPTPTPGVCLLFADGLRFDVGQRLESALEQSGLIVAQGWGFAALPSVTATAKPAASPVAPLLAGGESGMDFAPRLRADGRELTAQRFRDLLAAQGYAVVGSDDTGSPKTAGWTEAGRLDRLGHDEGWRLAHRIEEEVRTLAHRVGRLLNAGWKEIRIFTDHGWLLLPGGLPKVDLPDYLTETRWGRCAALKSTAHVQTMTVPWHWNAQVRVAVAPGTACFFAGTEYTHGGVSLQECVVPLLTVKASPAAPPPTSIEAVTWVGLRCRLQVAGGFGLKADLRTKAGDPSTSVVERLREIGADGQVSLAVPNDSLEGSAVHVVILGPNDQPVARQSTTIGG